MRSAKATLPTKVVFFVGIYFVVFAIVLIGGCRPAEKPAAPPSTVTQPAAGQAVLNPQQLALKRARMQMLRAHGGAMPLH